MRRQQTFIFLAAILAAGAVFGGCLRDTREAEELPITVTDSGVRVTLTSLKASDNLLILSFRVENEQPRLDTVRSATDPGGIAVQTELRYVNFTFRENANLNGGTASSNEATAEVEVTVERPDDTSLPVTFEFTQMLVYTTPGSIPLAVEGQWEFRFVPTAA